MGVTRSLLAIACLCGSMGCQSFSSTMLNRLGDNSFIGNSNGEANASNGARPFKGIPITLMVPSHLDVYIDEIYYLQGTKSGDGNSFSEIDEPLADGINRTQILKVRTELIKTKKVFTVDYKRPGSGTLNSNTTFSDEQYFASITNSITDTTITDSAALLTTVLKGASTSAGVTTDDELKKFEDIIRDTRVVAYKRFDINEPDFEAQVEVFVNQHLNGCVQPNSSPTYDHIVEPAH